MNRFRNNRLCSFTLIEMLVSVAILLILMGIALPIYSKVQRYQRRVKAREDIYGIFTAWTAYLQDYRHFPDVAITEMETNVAMNIMVGSNYNDLGHTYMEFTSNQWKTGFIDPWKGIYQVAIDNGKGNDDIAYDNNVKAGGYGKIEKSVAVWSLGLDGSDVGEAAQKDDVRSW